MDISVALGPAWAFMPDRVVYAIDLISERDFSASSASTVSGSPLAATPAPGYLNGLHVMERPQKEHGHPELRLRTSPEEIARRRCDDDEIRRKGLHALPDVRRAEPFDMGVYYLRPVPGPLKERL